MKFEDEAPDEQLKEGREVVRNQGAARAISVCIRESGLLGLDLMPRLDIHRSGSQLVGSQVVQKHHKE